MSEDPIAENVRRIRESMTRAAIRSGRNPDDLTLIAVTKKVAPQRISLAVQEGITDLGENYVQEALPKLLAPELSAVPINWHFIGHLQSNKAREVVGRFVAIHSVDSFSLAQELSRRAEKASVVVNILLEVKLDTSVDTKNGVLPEAVPELAAMISELKSIKLCGLMGMPPYVNDPELTRPYFQRLSRLYSQLPSENQGMLSMGMSGDFEVAIEEGATHVRIGTAIFGQRR